MKSSIEKISKKSSTGDSPLLPSILLLPKGDHKRKWTVCQSAAMIGKLDQEMVPYGVTISI
jgi:hypothetical protein